jgi:hypothetical protein
MPDIDNTPHITAVAVANESRLLALSLSLSLYGARELEKKKRLREKQ